MGRDEGRGGMGREEDQRGEKRETDNGGQRNRREEVKGEGNCMSAEFDGEGKKERGMTHQGQKGNTIRTISCTSNYSALKISNNSNHSQ